MRERYNRVGDGGAPSAAPERVSVIRCLPFRCASMQNRIGFVLRLKITWLHYISASTENAKPLRRFPPRRDHPLCRLPLPAGSLVVGRPLISSPKAENIV